MTFRSISEFVWCCRRTFQLFLELESSMDIIQKSENEIKSSLPEKLESFSLSPEGVRYAFKTITGFSYCSSEENGPLAVSRMDEEGFIAWMKKFAAVNETLLVENFSSTPRSIAWTLFDAIAGAKGFISIVDLERIESEKLYENLADKTIKVHFPFASLKTTESEDFRIKQSEHLSKENETIFGTTAGVQLFRSFSGGDEEKIVFSQAKPALSCA